MRGNAGKEVYCEPVDAYDRIATEYARISDARRAYLDSVDQLVVSEVPSGSRSLLDVGAGDGTRSLRIAEACRITEVVLLEPSANMRSKWPTSVTGSHVRAEELHRQNGRFDVITCLWNVLGHIFPGEARIEVLRQCVRLMATDGLIFVDVNHRYNMVHYGYVRTVLRMLRDRLFWNEHNGDVVASWNVAGKRYATRGHVFTDAEFCRMARAAGLTVRKSYVVDYATGRVRRSKLAGNVLYVLQRG